MWTVPVVPGACTWPDGLSNWPPGCDNWFFPNELDFANLGLVSVGPDSFSQVGPTWYGRLPPRQQRAAHWVVRPNQPPPFPLAERGIRPHKQSIDVRYPVSGPEEKTPDSNGCDKMTKGSEKKQERPNRKQVWGVAIDLNALTTTGRVITS